MLIIKEKVLKDGVSGAYTWISLENLCLFYKWWLTPSIIMVYELIQGTYNFFKHNFNSAKFMISLLSFVF